MTDTTELERAKKRPGLSFDYNLFRGPDGSVWTWVWEPEKSYVRMTREGMAPWTKTKDVQKLDESTLVRSFNEPDADWPWYRSPDGHTELRMREGTVQSARRGVAFANALLAQRKAIEGWAKEFVSGQDRRDNRSIDGDFPALLRTFFPFEDSDGRLAVPDNGSVLCALHAELDKLGGYEDIRAYYF